MPDVTVSVAVSDCVPAVFNVAVNEPAPLVRVELAGSAPWPSRLLTCPVPAQPVAVLPNESLAVTVKVPELPAVTVEGKPATVNVLTAAGFTVTVTLPVIELLAV